MLAISLPLHLPSCAPQRAIRTCLTADPAAERLWEVYDLVDYEAIMLSGAFDEDDDIDDSAEELTYGESDLGFCLSTVKRALDAAEFMGCSSSGRRNGFCDLGSGRGAMALGVALAFPSCLKGNIVALEIVRELCAIASAAFDISGDTRLLSRCGSFYDPPALERAVCSARCVYAYASKFASADGVHAEALSAALAAALRAAPDHGRGCVVTIVNRQLCERDGWIVAAPPLEGPTPEETAEVGLAHFYQLLPEE